MNEIDKKDQTGLSFDEMNEVQQFISDGLPGISSAKPELIKYGFQLYLENQSMGYISQKTGLKKKIILYLAFKNGWPEKRNEMYANLANTIKTRLETAKLQGLDYLTEMASASRQYFQDKIDLFKKTGDPLVLETLDPKVIGTYHKTLELLFKLGDMEGGDFNKLKAPLVGINLTEGATIKRENDNTVTVTPKTAESQTQALALSMLAAMNRLKEDLEEQKNKKEK